MLSVADLLTNALDLLALFLIAPGILGEEKMRRMYRRWVGSQLYLFGIPSWSPGLSRVSYVFFLLLLAGLAVVSLVPARVAPLVTPAVLMVISLVLLVGIITVIFDLSINRRGFERVLVLWGAGMFVIARLVGIGKAVGYWS